MTVFQLIVRIILVTIFAALGNFLARPDIPPNSPITLPLYTSILATFAFGTIGFFMPEFLSVVTKLGIARLAEGIAERIIAQLPALPKISQSSLHLPGTGRKKQKQNQKMVNQMILDTSAIIDGRFADIAETGFLYGTIIVLPSVLAELRHIADSGDDLKRARGRRGLDVLDRLRKNKYLNVEILKNEPEGHDVDDKIFKIARLSKAKIVTTDFNLNKIATVSGVKTLNVNELANSVKTVALPGEQMKVKVIHKGKETSQGVGYLADGTMIVVEDGADLVGKTVNVKVARILQTVAGRMVFVKPT